MAGTWISERFPQFEPAIRQLTEQHRPLQDEPLHLAVSYGPERGQQDIFLFEVIGVGGRPLCEDHELFETVFTSHSGFPMRADQPFDFGFDRPGLDLLDGADYPRSAFPREKELAMAAIALFLQGSHVAALCNASAMSGNELQQNCSKE